MKVGDRVKYIGHKPRCTERHNFMPLNEHDSRFYEIIDIHSDPDGSIFARLRELVSQPVPSTGSFHDDDSFGDEPIERTVFLSHVRPA